MRFTNDCQVLILLHSFLKFADFILKRHKVLLPFSTLVGIRIRQLIPASAEVLTSAPNLLRVVVADIDEGAPCVCEIIFNPPLQVGVIANIDDTIAQRRVQIFRTLAS